MIVAWHREPVGPYLTVTHYLGAGDPPGAVQLLASGDRNPKNKRLPIFDASSPCSSAHTCRCNGVPTVETNVGGVTVRVSTFPFASVELESRENDDDDLWACFNWTAQGDALIRGGHRYLIVTYYARDRVSSIAAFGLSLKAAEKPKARREVPLAQAPSAHVRSDDGRNPETNLSAFDVDSGMLFRA